METIAKYRKKLAEIRQSGEKLRSRQLAERIGISELELLSLELSDDIIRLNDDCKGMLLDMHEMGYVMALSRNEHCVHERKGVYDNIEFYEGAHNMGVAVNPDIDLRFFMSQWVYAMAVIMRRDKGKDLYSFQFYNERGEAVHKVFSTPKSDLDAYHKLINKYRAQEQTPILIEDRSKPEPKEEKPDSEVDVAAFQEAWRNMTDTHQFFGMLRKHGVSRTQAFRLAPPEMVDEVDRLAVSEILEKAAEKETPIMCFVHSPGCVQIHSGPVKKLVWYGDWYNVMDPKFNLHLDTTAIDRCFVVRKPTDDGMVTSLELFDKEGQLIVYFFGARKPGIPELTEWRNLLENLIAERRQTA
ncbi:MAG: ChuX/HutX family heme-like substrate-binding protein [Bacteroidota bacterium]